VGGRSCLPTELRSSSPLSYRPFTLTVRSCSYSMYRIASQVPSPVCGVYIPLFCPAATDTWYGYALGLLRAFPGRLSFCLHFGEMRMEMEMRTWMRIRRRRSARRLLVRLDLPYYCVFPLLPLNSPCAFDFPLHFCLPWLCPRPPSSESLAPCAPRVPLLGARRGEGISRDVQMRTSSRTWVDLIRGDEGSGGMCD
jgi:hypothetical protein